MIELIKFLSLGILIYVSLFYLIATFIRNWSIIDIAWGPGFVLIAFLTLYHSQNINTASLIITGLTSLWAIRLALHIGIRNIGKEEDFRYANWRKKWQPYPEIQGFFRVFILQGTIMFTVSLPIIISIYKSSSSFNILYALPGILIFFIGFIIEAIADMQLAKFKKDESNKGKLIRGGLWSISRHPNYLGEIILWWGLGLFALLFEYGILGLLGPLCIHLIIRYISIPVLEEKWEKRNDWDHIKKEIPVLFPSIKIKI